jgi:hypothetical protein
MTVKKHTPSGAQSSTSARNQNHPAKSDRQKGKAKARANIERAIRAQVDADGKAAQPHAMKAYLETYDLYLKNPEAAKVAERCVEIWNAQRARDKEQGTDGCYHFMACGVDPILDCSSDGLMVGSPDDALFTYLFMRAAAEYKDEPTPNQYTDLLDLIKSVDEGADLAELHRKEYPHEDTPRLDTDTELSRAVLAVAYPTEKVRRKAANGVCAKDGLLYTISEVASELNLSLIHPDILPAALPVIVREARKLAKKPRSKVKFPGVQQIAREGLQAMEKAVGDE